MSRALLGGERPRFFDENGHPFTSPARLVFTDGSTTLPKPVYFSPTSGSSATIVDLVDNGYVPVSGIWLESGTYNMALQVRVSEFPELWSTNWTLEAIPGGSAESENADLTIAYADTVQEIRLLSVLGGIVFNTGYYVKNDGGQGMWRWNSASLEDDDGGAYLLPNGQSPSVPGRWMRIMPSNGLVSIGMWGATVDVADASSNIRKACLWCARNSNQTGTTLEFPSGRVNIGSAALVIDSVGTVETGLDTFRMGVIVRNSFKFIGTGSVTFDAPTKIESNQPIVSADIDLFFGSHSGINQINLLWAETHSKAGEYAYASNVGVYIESSVTLTSNLGTNANRVPSITLKDGVRLTQGDYRIYAKTLVVEGSKRKALVATNISNYPVIGNYIIEAWWFGYGVDASTTDHTKYLYYASYYSGENNATLRINGVEINCSVGTINVLCRSIIDGFIPVASGGIVTISHLNNNPQTRIFNLADDTSYGKILSGSVNPIWYGVSSSNDATTNSAYWNDCVRCLNYGQVIKGNDEIFYVNPLLSLPVFSTLRNLYLSLATSSDGQIFSTTSILSFDAKDCSFVGYGANPLPVFDVKLSSLNSSISIKNCKTVGGITVGVTGSNGIVSVIGNNILNGYLSVHSSSSTLTEVKENVCNNGMINVNATESNMSNISITNNVIRGADSYGCDIQIWTNIVGTNVKNLIISNNILQWTGSTSETILISTWAYGGGGFATWQDVYVGGNTVTSQYTSPTTYPEVGAVQGPYASSTHGTDVVLFDEFQVSVGYPVEGTNTQIVRIGPMFLGSESQSKTFNSHISSISGEIYAQQIDDINSDGVQIDSAHFYLGVSNADPITGGRFYQARAEVKYRCISSGDFTFWVRPRAIITWGDRAQIGKYSKVY